MNNNNNNNKAYIQKYTITYTKRSVLQDTRKNVNQRRGGGEEQIKAMYYIKHKYIGQSTHSFNVHRRQRI